MSEKTQTKDSVVRDIFILVVITLAAGMLLGAAYGVTKEPIARAQAREKEQAQRAVMQDAASFRILAQLQEAETDQPGGGAELLGEINRILEEKGITNTRVNQIDEALDEAGNTSGYVITGTNSEGYGGEVELMCGVSASEENALRIEGISFLTLTETAGMGMRAKEDSFTQQFAGKMIRPGETLTYTRDGDAGENEIDAISGCTITTSAVTKDVNAALEAVRTVLEHPGAGTGKDAGGEE